MGVYAKLKFIVAAITIEAKIRCHWEPHPSLPGTSFVIQHETELPLSRNRDVKAADDVDDDDDGDNAAFSSVGVDEAGNEAAASLDADVNEDSVGAAAGGNDHDPVVVGDSIDDNKAAAPEAFNEAKLFFSSNDT